MLNPLNQIVNYIFTSPIQKIIYVSLPLNLDPTQQFGNDSINDTGRLRWTNTVMSNITIIRSASY